MSLASKPVFCLGAFLLATQAKAAPDFSPNPAVGWIAIQNEFQPPPSGAGPVRQDPARPRVTNDEYRATGRQPTLPLADLNNPILQPWTRDALAKQNALAESGKGGLGRGASCWPLGVPGFMLHVVQPYFFVQSPKEVVLIWQGDHMVRHIYMTDKHSPNVQPSWFGESIGHYEGDELVIDTIGLSTKTFIDSYYTPHTEKLHVVEHIRMTNNGDRLENRLHVEDQGAFTMPWDAILRFRRVEPGRAENNVALNPVSSSTDAGPLLEVSCAENPFSYFGSESIPVPQAATPDF